MMQRWVPFCILFLSLSAGASIAELDAGVASMAAAYEKAGGNPKALAQLRCFLAKHGAEVFAPKPVVGELAERCNQRNEIKIENFKAVGVIDYTKLSDRPRFFIFDLEAKKVQALHVGHGRFGDTNRGNTQFSDNPKRNSILKVAHFSNTPNSNATAGGFFLTGQEYDGAYKRSLVLHGLEKDVNDNACFRTTVIHKSSMITETATKRMSSGCPMVAQTKIAYVLKAMSEGALLYAYTPAEAALGADECGRGLLKSGAPLPEPPSQPAPPEDVPESGETI